MGRMDRMEKCYYIRDLELRQNREITTAELDLFKNAKRYSNKDIKECIKEMNINIDRKELEYELKETRDKLNIHKRCHDFYYVVHMRYLFLYILPFLMFLSISFCSFNRNLCIFLKRK